MRCERASEPRQRGLGVWCGAVRGQLLFPSFQIALGGQDRYSGIDAFLRISLPRLALRLRSFRVVCSFFHDARVCNLTCCCTRAHECTTDPEAGVRVGVHPRRLPANGGTGQGARRDAGVQQGEGQLRHRA